MGKLFGTDGIRGIANRYPMTPQMAVKLGRAIAKFVSKEQAIAVVGRDTRASGPMLECALAAGLMSEGASVFTAGVIPTPGIAYLARELNADIGIVISASHNPFKDNGIKVFSQKGVKLTEAQELTLEEFLFSLDDEPEGHDIGQMAEVHNPVGRYVEFLRSQFPHLANLHGSKIVIDCANGATHSAAPALFTGLGAKVESIATAPNGRNINERCGSQYPQGVVDKVLEIQAQVGFAFDGDGDRVVAVDEKGQVLTGDQLLAIFAKMLKEQGRLRNNVVVSTVMSNIGLKTALEKMGIDHIATQVGDRNVYHEMIKRGAVLGGEDSGHIILLRHHSTGDGMLSALQLIGAMKYFGKPLSELGTFMEVYPQVLLNVPVIRKPPFNELPAVEQTIKKVEGKLGKSGRVLVRYSGTENVCRIMVEGENKGEIMKLAQEIASALQRAIGQ